MTMRRLIGHAGRILIGLVFLAAGLLKTIDPEQFARQIAGYGIVGAGFAGLAAPVLIAFEVTLGVVLIAGAWPRAGALIGVTLLLAFIGVEAYGLAKGRTESCGCFGAYVQRTPAQVIAEDLVFIGFGLLAWWGLRGWDGLRAGRALRIAAVTAAGALGLAIASPALPIDPWVTGLRAGTTVAGLPVGPHLSDLGDGRALVAVFDVGDAAAAGIAGSLNDLAAHPGAPRVVALTPAEVEAIAGFQWTAVPAFEVRRVDPPVLKRIYRRLPRFFLVEGGRVRAVYDVAAPRTAELFGTEGP
jgi:uncharacterized membrane protein YphA (DoxX/SURF4 family)